MDCEGGSQPTDESGASHIFTYVCCLCHGVLLEALRGLSAREVRRAFARCMFRSGTIPWLLRSDRGQEFTNLLMKEFVALVGSRKRFGIPWRPTNQAGVERINQEMQKIWGIVLLAVMQAVRSSWSDALCVVEFLSYNTPGPHKFTPRDLDRSWTRRCR